MSVLHNLVKGVTEEQLKVIFPQAPADKIKTYAAAMNKLFPLYQMNTARRISAFLGQIGVESGQLRFDKELPSSYNKVDPKDKTELTGSRYCNRKTTLGNYVCVASKNDGKHTADCDGPKYIGRGCLQVTGRQNYTRLGDKLGIDLVKFPERLLEPEVGLRAALLYWNDRNLNAQADAWNLDEVTRRVNGTAKLHHKERVEISERAIKLLEPKDERIC